MSLLLLSMVVPVFADWADYDYVWFEGWNKRQVLRVDQTTGAGANYELKINVTWTEDYRNDFKDLRITYLNGTDLTWWIEQIADGSFCALWLKVPVDLDSESFDCFWWSQNPIADTYYNSSATDVFKRVISSGVVLALPLDEGSGTVATDYSNNGINGVVTATWTTAGKFGNGLSFNGATDNIAFGDQDELELAAGNFSFVTYYLSANNPTENFARIADKGNFGTFYGWGWWIRSDTGRCHFQYCDNATHLTVEPAVDVADGTQRTISFVYPTAANQGTMYLGTTAYTGTHTGTLRDSAAATFNAAGIGTGYSLLGVLSGLFILSTDLSAASISDFNSYYPQCSSANLGSLFLRTYVSGGVSYGFIVMEDTSNMDYIYLVGLLGVIGISLVLFKLKLGVVGLVWGIFGIAIAASLAGNQAVPFYPYLTLGVAVVGTLLVLYSGYEMRGA